MAKGRQRDITLANPRVSQSKNYIQATILPCKKPASHLLCFHPYMHVVGTPGAPFCKHHEQAAVPPLTDSR